MGEVSQIAWMAALGLKGGRFRGLEWGKWKDGISTWIGATDWDRIIFRNNRGGFGEIYRTSSEGGGNESTTHILSG
jgi:hypothetical protein